MSGEIEGRDGGCMLTVEIALCHGGAGFHGAITSEARLGLRNMSIAGETPMAPRRGGSQSLTIEMAVSRRSSSPTCRAGSFAPASCVRAHQLRITGVGSRRFPAHPKLPR